MEREKNDFVSHNLKGSYMTCLVLKYVSYEVVVRNDTCLFHWV